MWLTIMSRLVRLPWGPGSGHMAGRHGSSRLNRRNILTILPVESTSRRGKAWETTPASADIKSETGSNKLRTINSSKAAKRTEYKPNKVQQADQQNDHTDDRPVYIECI